MSEILDVESNPIDQIAEAMQISDLAERTPVILSILSNLPTELTTCQETLSLILKALGYATYEEARLALSNSEAR